MLAECARVQKTLDSQEATAIKEAEYAGPPQRQPASPQTYRSRHLPGSDDPKLLQINERISIREFRVRWRTYVQWLAPTLSRDIRALSMQATTFVGGSPLLCAKLQPSYENSDYRQNCSIQASDWTHCRFTRSVNAASKVTSCLFPTASTIKLNRNEHQVRPKIRAGMTPIA